MFSNESNSSKNYTTKIGKKFFFLNSEEQIRAEIWENMATGGSQQAKRGRQTNNQGLTFFVLLSNMEWQARWHSAREAGWLADWVGGEEVGEARPPVPSLLRCDQAPLREQWPL